MTPTSLTDDEMRTRQLISSNATLGPADDDATDTTDDDATDTTDDDATDTGS